MDKQDNKHNLALLLLVAIFSGSLVISQILAVKIVSWHGVVFPAGVIAYSITFIVTDVLSEVFGKKVAQYAVWAGFATVLVCLLLIYAALSLPAASFWTGEKSFERVLLFTPRIIVASLLAYVISQVHDVWAFHFWKKITKGKHLWLRNNLSTIVSQLIDTSTFIFVAFGGGDFVLNLIWGQFLVKMSIALLDTPLVYLLVGWLNATPNLVKQE